MSVPLQAASILLGRSAGSTEVYLVRRSLALRFMGGMVAFPGGKLDPGDAALARPDDRLDARHVAAARELFEETGVLLARRGDGSFPPADAALPEQRRAMLGDTLSFAELLQRRGLHLDAADLGEAGRLVTPPFVPTRFDTTFFVASLPPGQTPQVWDGELTDGAWWSAAAALDAWACGELPLSPPTVTILQTITGRSIDEAPQRLLPVLQRLQRGGIPPIWPHPGVLLIPLASAGLPPTTHTNAYLVGTGPCYLLDPGPVDAAEQARLFDALEHRRVDAVLLSHHHPDHVGAATACARRFGVPVLAHARTAELLAGRVPVDRLLADGETLDLGEAPHGGRWAMRALLTPGHAPGHLAFYEPAARLLFAGDMVSPLSSMIVSPEDGDLTAYLASLHRLRELPTRLLLPSHGGPSLRPQALFDEALAHRATRERHLREALADGPRTLDELTLTLYRGFPEAVRKLGRLQIEAGLIKLTHEGAVHCQGSAWMLTPQIRPGSP